MSMRLARIALTTGLIVLMGSTAASAQSTESHVPDPGDFPDTAGYVDDLTHASESCSPGEVAAGETVTATFQGYELGTTATAIYNGVVVFQGPVDANPFTFSFVVGEGTTGSRTLEFTGTASDGTTMTRTCQVALVLGENVALARTGSDSRGMVAAALALVLVGASSLVWSRRRTPLHL